MLVAGKGKTAVAHPGLAAMPAGEDVAVDFLEKLRPGGPWTLTAIVPDGETTTITAGTASEVRAFVQKYARARYSIRHVPRQAGAGVAQTQASPQG